MALHSSDKLSGLFSSLIHQKTQQHTLHMDLTVAEIHKVTSAGTLDFGGSEFKPAETAQIEPDKQNPGHLRIDYCFGRSLSFIRS